MMNSNYKLYKLKLRLFNIAKMFSLAFYIRNFVATIIKWNRVLLHNYKANDNDNNGK